MITYEKKDKKYGLFLHSTGFTVSISKAGQITYFYRTEEEFSIRYSNILVTEEAALGKYVNGLDFELMIQKFDKEVYKNGDNQYHLAYSVIEQVMDIPVDGSETFSIREEHHVEPKIQEMEIPQRDIYELIGITSDYKLLGKQVENGKRMEVWSRCELVQSFSFDLDDQDHHVVKLCFDDKTGKLLRVLTGEEHENEGEEIGLYSALQQALQVMFKIFPNAYECFRLETLDEEAVVDDEEDFNEAEAAIGIK